jgi:hypothetical protein
MRSPSISSTAWSEERTSLAADRLITGDEQTEAVVQTCGDSGSAVAGPAGFAASNDSSDHAGAGINAHGHQPRLRMMTSPISVVPTTLVPGL